MDPHETAARPPRRRRREPARLDPSELERIALRYASRWETSAAGVALHLERKLRERGGASDDEASAAITAIPEIVETLIARGYVDDERFAAAAVDRLRRQGRSTRQIESHLRAKGISEAIAAALLRSRAGSDHDLAAAWRLARRRRLGPYCEDPERRRRDRARQLALFARQGFDRDVAERVLDADRAPESE